MRRVDSQLARTSGHSIEMIRAHNITEADPVPDMRTLTDDEFLAML